MLSIAPSEGKGRGVFTDSPIEEGALVERCPVIVIPQAEREIIDDTVLYNYIFYWQSASGSGAVALGYGSLYNHSYKPNAIFRRQLEDKVIDIISIKKIEAGQEIVVNYHGSPKDPRPLWKPDEINWKE